MFSYVLVAIFAYLLGDIPCSYIVGKITDGSDVRKKGSGNAGSTNVLRNYGKKAAIIAFLGDVFKGVFAVVFAGFLASKNASIDVNIARSVAAVFVVFGHNWPALMGFKGGKGVATSLGAMLAISPIVALACLGIFIIIVYFTKYVSLGSVVAIPLSIVFMIIRKDYIGMWACIMLSISSTFSHRDNIKRLLKGEERKISSKKKK